MKPGLLLFASLLFLCSCSLLPPAPPGARPQQSPKAQAAEPQQSPKTQAQAAAPQQSPKAQAEAPQETPKPPATIPAPTPAGNTNTAELWRKTLLGADLAFSRA